MAAVNKYTTFSCKNIPFHLLISVFFQQELQFLNIRQIIPLNSARARNYSPLSKIDTAKLKIQAIFSRKFAQHIHHF